jgi:hypothetical protein
MLNVQRFAIFREKLFWIKDIKGHKKADIRTEGDYCFNRIVTLSSKDEPEKPIFDYEMQLV